MDRFSNFRNYLNSVNRGVLLAVGLVVVAGLIAAVFVYGDTNDIADNNNGEQVAEENGVTSDNGEETEAREAEEDEARDEDRDVAGEETVTVGPEGEALPSELADAGPAAPLLAMSLLGGSAYLYRRSKKGVEETNRSV